MAIELIYNHIEHHARHSGYDQLADYVGATAFESKGLPGQISRRIGWKQLRRMPYYHSSWYGGPALRREIEICLRMLLPRRTIYHFFYAENDLRVSSLWKCKLNNKIVGSFHQPPEFLDTLVEDKRYIRGVNAAVVMSRSQVPYMEQFLDSGRIHHVPHGVHTGYWCPREGPRFERPTFLVVGQWLRDIELVVAAIRRVNQLDPEVHFKIITFEEYAGQFEGLENTEVRWGIPDEELLESYQRSHALLLPLKMSTANNAVLEAMSCGTGVISTNTGGVPEYLDAECGVLVEPGDVEGTVQAIRRIAANPSVADAMGVAARRRAIVRYDWHVVGAQMMDAYEQILRTN